MIAAITGYIGSGKTTAAKIFESEGFTIINADKIAHRLLNSKTVRDKITTAFGMDILTRKLEIDREKLGKTVFNDETRLRILDSIIHPPLEIALKNEINETHGNIVIDIALLSELHLKDLCEIVILIKSDILQVYEKLRDRYSKREILKIMNAQKIVSDADYIIINNSTVEELRKKVIRVCNEIKTRNGMI